MNYFSLSTIYTVSLKSLDAVVYIFLFFIFVFLCLRRHKKIYKHIILDVYVGFFKSYRVILFCPKLLYGVKANLIIRKPCEDTSTSSLLADSDSE